MEYNLVSACNENIELLISYKLKTITDYALYIDKIELQKINNYVESQINDYLSNYKIIIINNNIIGCLLFYKYEDGVLLDEIYIEPKFRNLGIGTKIISDIINDNNIIYLWVYKENKMAINLYTKLGFRVEGETETRFFMKYNI